VFVRTTLDLSDDAYQIAKTVAREQKRSLGRVVSDFITGRFGPPAPVTDVEPEGFPVFRCTRRVTSEDVKAALDDEP
jgi:methionine synthase I (cobalamin-dependent)